MNTRSFLIFIFLLIFSYSPCFADMVPFVIPGHQDAGSLVAIQNQPIAPDSNRIEVVGDKFYKDGQRIKMWGMNLSFRANLPATINAPYAAERLAAGGMNAVRCHDMDTRNYPEGLWHPTTGETIYSGAMDRLDYFINELADNGVYIYLCLHVGRAHSQYLGLPYPNTDYDKMVSIFTPAIVQAQKDFARDLLEHVNPYRGLSYANDPAIAFVEVTNENNLFMWGADETLRNLSPYYADILQQQYNTWLGNEYGDSNGLRDYWNIDVEPPGDNVLTSFDDHFNDPNVDPNDKWYLEEHEGCQASLEPNVYQSQSCAELTIDVTDEVSWHLQAKQVNLEIVEGQYYTLSFEGAADAPRTIGCDVVQDHDPWGNLGLYESVNLGTDWQSYYYGFVATASDANGRVAFRFGGGDDTTFYLRNPQLYTGGQVGLMEDEFIETGTVRLFADPAPLVVKERQIDRVRFLAETEKAFFNDMRSYIKNDLGCDALVTGSIVFGPLGFYTQSDMDFIECHHYWQHPQWPGAPWDPNNWFINQKAMTDHMDEAVLFDLASCRLGKSPNYPGKPFIISEYNHPAPLDSQAECVGMLTSFAAAQDWDGLWLFAYTDSMGKWNNNCFEGSFDLMHNPAKWGFSQAGAGIFRYGGIEPVGDTYYYAGITDANESLFPIAELYLQYGLYMYYILADNAGISREDLLNNRIATTLNETGSIYSPNDPNRTELDWEIGGDGKGIYSARGKSAWVYIGHQDKFASASDNKVEVNEPNFAAITVTYLAPGQTKIPLPEGQKILITACGRSENTGMIFSPDRKTVNTNWGGPPVLIETVEAKIRLPLTGLSCYALEPNGLIKSTVPTTIENNETVIEISSDYGTMWYMLVETGDVNNDGIVDFGDFSKLGQYWLLNEQSVDISTLPFGDGIVDFRDLAILIKNWLEDTTL